MSEWCIVVRHVKRELAGICRDRSGPYGPGETISGLAGIAEADRQPTWLPSAVTYCRMGAGAGSVKDTVQASNFLRTMVQPLLSRTLAPAAIHATQRNLR